MTLFPIPQKLDYTEGSCPVCAPVEKVCDTALGREEYKIAITPAGVTLTASCDEGFFRAQTTLKQIIAQNPAALPCLAIHDWPDFPVRGLWHSPDIPSMRQMKHLIDLLADMKMNHLEFELYSANYVYGHFPQFNRQGNSYTPEEIRELSRYAKERYIDLVPNMQTFGHLNDWLEDPAIREFAELPEGFEKWGSHQTPGTLNPLDPRSQAFVRQVLDDVLPAFPDSRMINIGCDETWELGQGKSKDECERLGKTRVFLNFVSQTIQYLTEKGFKPLFWADIILQGSQEVLNAIPKDSVALNWGYERWEVTEDSCIRLQKTGVPYWNAPGTSVWLSMIGQSYKAMQNIARSAVLGKRYGASGLLNTNWHGDRHASHAYVPIAYGAAMGWNTAEGDWREDAPRDDLSAIVEPDAAQIVKVSPTMAACFDYLNRFVFMDQRGKMAQIAYDAGLYAHISRHPGIHNQAQPVAVLNQPPDKKETYGYDVKDYRDMQDYLAAIAFRLEHETQLCARDGNWILDEYRDTLARLNYACDIALYHLGERRGMSPEEYALWMNNRRKSLIQEYFRVWAYRHRVRRKTLTDEYIQPFTP